MPIAAIRKGNQKEVCDVWTISMEFFKTSLRICAEKKMTVKIKKKKGNETARTFLDFNYF